MKRSGSVRSGIGAGCGALAILVGVFAPALRVEVYGDVSFFDAFEAPGAALVVVAAASLFAVARRTPSWLRWLAPAAWLALLWPMLGSRLWPHDDNVFTQLQDALQSRLSDTVSDALLHVSEFSWGPWLLLSGCVLLTVAAFRARG